MFTPNSSNRQLNPACFANSGTGTNPSVWFTFIGDGNIVDISTDFVGGTNTDTEVALYTYTGTCPTTASTPTWGDLTELGCSQDLGGGNFLSTIGGFQTTNLTEYYVQVAGWGVAGVPDAVGTFCLEVTVNASCEDGAGPCDASDTYCNCLDCSANCGSAAMIFYDLVAGAISTDTIMYCPGQFTGGTNTVPDTGLIYMAPLSLNGDLACVEWLVQPSEGQIYVNSTTDADPASNNGLVNDGFLFVLAIDDAGIAASGGTTTITYTAQNDLNSPACEFTSTVNWSGPDTLRSLDLSEWSGSVIGECPGLTCNDDSMCDANEGYCNCADCSMECDSSNVLFIQMLPTIAGSASPIAYCPSELGGTNSSPDTIYIPIAPLSNSGALDCVEWLVAPSEGQIYASFAVPADDDPLSNNGLVDDGFIYYLAIDDAGIASATGGITTITYTAQNDINSPACTYTSQVDWNGTILQSDLSAWSGSASGQCGIMTGCEPEYTMANGNRLMGTEIGVADYETDGTLESEQTIEATATVDYDSASDILLLPGFNTVPGALFVAFIDGCMGAMFGGNSSIEKSNDDKPATINANSETDNNEIKSDYINIHIDKIKE